MGAFHSLTNEMIELLKTNRLKIEELCREFGVVRLEVFGSAARGDFDPRQSDLDFLLEFEDYGPGIADRYFGFVEAMEDHFGRNIDTVFGPRVKSEHLQREIDRSRELIYEAKGRGAAA